MQYIWTENQENRKKKKNCNRIQIQKSISWHKWQNPSWNLTKYPRRKLYTYTFTKELRLLGLDLVAVSCSSFCRSESSIIAKSIEFRENRADALPPSQKKNINTTGKRIDRYWSLPACVNWDKIENNDTEHFKSRFKYSEWSFGKMLPLI